MIKLIGKVASSGFALGNIVEITHKNTYISKKKINDITKEIDKFNNALNKAIIELDDLYNNILKELDEEHAHIFLAHKMLLEDPDYKGNIINVIKNNNFKAEYAVDIIGKQFENTFLSLEDEYMRARAADFRDISKRVIKIILGRKTINNVLPVNSIVVADDLDPSETIHLDRSKVIGFITRNGSINSHTAILARTINIPAIVGVDIKYGLNNKQVLIKRNEVIIDPTSEELDLYLEEYNKYIENNKLLNELKGKKVITKSNKKIKLYANIGSIDDVNYALDNDACGIGLFRTEFIYLESKQLPTEEEQFSIYKKVVEKMGNKEVVIRTIDFGADKKSDYLNFTEENPALGYRAIRICLTKEDIFKTQLRAIYRASIFGNVKIMFPMIISEWEIIRVKEIIEEVKNELLLEKIEFIDIELGITIETPAAVMICDDLAKHVNFFSIGTNDLTQYTLAVDRQNQNLEKFYDPHHKAIMKMIKIVIDNAKSNNISVGICGELGADVSLTKEFIKMGIDELSLAPSMILPIKKIILEIE